MMESSENQRQPILPEVRKTTISSQLAAPGGGGGGVLCQQALAAGLSFYRLSMAYHGCGSWWRWIRAVARIYGRAEAVVRSVQ